MFEWLRFPTPSKEVNDALGWNYYGADIPFGILEVLLGIVLLLYIVGGIGFIFFVSWSRHVLAFSFFNMIALIPFEEIYVTTGVNDFIKYLGNILFLVPFVLSFFHPCCNYFSQESKRTNEVSS